MPEPVRVLEGRTATGIASVSEAPRRGMITLRAAHDTDLADLLDATGLGLPARRRIESYAAGQVGWMSPDELLILAAPGAVPGLLDDLAARLAQRHHLVADVSDARAMLRVDGPGAAQVLAKLCPVDLLDGRFAQVELRRTHLAQIPAAFWRDGDGFTVICFRSVALYAFEALRVAARPGTAIDALPAAEQ